jgi:hypothetical protein
LLVACAGKADYTPHHPYIRTGAYRSAAIDELEGRDYRLELKSNGRFRMLSYAEGCLVRAETGAWSSGQDYLELRIGGSQVRGDCASPWRFEASGKSLTCPLRGLAVSSFEMLHDGIRQGTLWTRWDRMTEIRAAEGAPAAGVESLSLTAGE